MTRFGARLVENINLKLRGLKKEASRMHFSFDIISNTKNQAKLFCPGIQNHFPARTIAVPKAFTNPGMKSVELIIKWAQVQISDIPNSCGWPEWKKYFKAWNCSIILSDLGPFTSFAMKRMMRKSIYIETHMQTARISIKNEIDRSNDPPTKKQMINEWLHDFCSLVALWLKALEFPLRSLLTMSIWCSEDLLHPFSRLS